MKIARETNRMAKRLPGRVEADPRRVITRLFLPGGEDRVRAVVERVMALPQATASGMLDNLVASYSSRHKNIRSVFLRHYDAVASYVVDGRAVSEPHRLLLGAYVTLEYSLESVALFNPSMVVHPNQRDVSPGSARFLMSVRACGEGHISSIAFRTGIIQEQGDVTFDKVSPYAMTERPVPDKLYNKARFFRKLIEMGAYNPLADDVLAPLAEQFTIADLHAAIDAICPVEGYDVTWKELTSNMLWLVHSNYHLSFPKDSAITERVIFPVSENESRGIEDARFVRFHLDDGSTIYYATYTAYNGFRTLPQFIETADFRRFKIYTLNGKCVQNKGMAMFPRKIGDDYCMVSRLDGENLYLLRSDSFHFWNECELLRTPVQPWEFVQIGNCGSPIETEQGWLLLTHGVGPMRQYWMGALLLDLENPARVIGYLKEPWLIPDESERNGYVPNVVYSCGAILHHNNLIVPYAASDSFIRVATVPLEQMLAGFVRS